MKKPKCILLDVEGTTSSISFVHDVMFPYARSRVASFLDAHWDDPSVTDCLPLLSQELEYDSVDQWLGDDQTHAKQRVVEGVSRLMDGDVKATGLKKLQGAIWKSGFESGEMTAHLYDDVAPAIRRWNQDGISIRIYSSGSVQAQKLFFGHCVAGDLLPLLSGHYDTTTGGKKEAASYVTIANDIGLMPNEVLFVSDVPMELDAAQSAGMQTVLSIRPGNQRVPEPHGYFAITSFDAIKFETVASNG